MFSPARFALAMIAAATLVLPCAPAPDTVLDPKSDPRLAKTVTLYFAPTPLGELLQKLSQQTGVVLNAERTVAMHRAILVVHDKPLHECLQRLADAFGYSWQKVETKDKSPRYMLYQTSRSLAEQRTQLAKYQQLPRRVLQEVLKTLAGIEPASYQREWERMRDEYQARRKSSQPAVKNYEEAIQVIARRMLGECSISWDRWNAAVLLAKLPPPMWARLEQGETLTFRTDAPDSLLAPDFARIWREIEEELLNRPSPQGGNEESERMRELHRRNLQRVNAGWISLLIPPVSRQPMYASGLASGEIDMLFGTSRPLWYSYNEIAYLTDQLLHPVQETASEVTKRFAQPLRKPSLDLSEQVDLAGNLLARFARANRVNIASEWYPYPPSYVWDEHRVESTDVVEWNALAAFLQDYRYELKPTDDWLLVTQRLRPLCRHHDIPEPSIRRWLWKRGQEGEINLEDLMEICALLPDQIVSLVHKMDRLVMRRGGDQFPPYPLRVMGNYPYTQMAVLALASLPPALRNAVLQGNPLPFATLPTQTRRLLTLAVFCSERWVSEQAEQVPWERTVFAIRAEEQTRVEPDERAPARIREGFYTQGYEDWLAGLSEEERKRYTRLRFTRRIVFVLGDHQTDYFVTEVYWDRRLKPADEGTPGQNR